jgi:hypothetical protein
MENLRVGSDFQQVNCPSHLEIHIPSDHNARFPSSWISAKWSGQVNSLNCSVGVMIPYHFSEEKLDMSSYFRNKKKLNFAIFSNLRVQPELAVNLDMFPDVRQNATLKTNHEEAELDDWWEGKLIDQNAKLKASAR